MRRGALSGSAQRPVDVLRLLLLLLLALPLPPDPEWFTDTPRRGPSLVRAHRLYVVHRCKQLKVLDFRKVKQKVRAIGGWQHSSSTQGWPSQVPPLEEHCDRCGGPSQWVALRELHPENCSPPVPAAPGLAIRRMAAPHESPTWRQVGGTNRRCADAHCVTPVGEGAGAGSVRGGGRGRGCSREDVRAG